MQSAAVDSSNYRACSRPIFFNLPKVVTLLTPGTLQSVSFASRFDFEAPFLFLIKRHL